MALDSTSSPNRQPTQKVTIFTDNQSVIQAVSAPHVQSGQQILRFIVLAINKLREQHIDVELRWIPAHIGVKGNEMADKAARMEKSQEEERKIG